MVSSVARMPTAGARPFVPHLHLNDPLTREVQQQKNSKDSHSRETGNVDLGPNVRTLSLIQMWRELEAEAGGPQTPARGSEGGIERKLVRLRCRQEMEDLVERMHQEREREVSAIAQLQRVSRFPHRGRIQSMLKLRFLWKDFAIQNQTRLVSKKGASERSESRASIFLLREKFNNQSQNGNGVPVVKRSSTVNVEFPIDCQDSCSSYSADHLCIDNNQYQEVISIEDPECLSPESTSPQSRGEDLPDEITSAELKILHSRTKEGNEANQYNGFNSLDSVNNNLHKRHQNPENSLHSRIECLCEGCQSPEINSSRFRGGDPLEERHNPEFNSRHSVSEYLQEGCQNLELSLLDFRREDLHDGRESPETPWDERNLWTNNLDWQRNMGSSNVYGWQSGSEVVPKEIEPYSQQDIINTGHTWMGDSYISWRGWGFNSQEYRDYVETFSDNMEIRELLERRRVTTSLASDFCDKMNQMIKTFLQRQGEQYIKENFAEDYGEEPTWRHNYDFNNVDQVLSDSSSVPSSYRMVHFPDSSQHTSFIHHSSHNLQELESAHNLKNEMAQMRQEISDLRKLVESCMEWQAKLQYSIKDEVSYAIRQSVLVARTLEGSKRTSGQKDSCCICHEMQVDSLLYRCGHMCTCFKCAHELQQNSGTCPVCQAPIIDAVRAYPNTE